MKLKLAIFSAFLALTLLIGVPGAEAATLVITPQEGEFYVGQIFDVAVKVQSPDEAFNSVQATIQFPKDKFEVKSLDFSPQATVFNFWLEEPKFSNQDGTVTFIGGTTNGITGSGVQILKISFTAKGVGEGDVLFNDAAIVASDGNGTNILSTLPIARFKINPQSQTVSAPKPVSNSIASAQSPAPQTVSAAASSVQPPVAKTAEPETRKADDSKELALAVAAESNILSGQLQKYLAVLIATWLLLVGASAGVMLYFYRKVARSIENASEALSNLTRRSG
ncbi:MAG: cohesin domain-containing protein [Candidatus Sungiibacteriota bacterium]